MLTVSLLVLCLLIRMFPRLVLKDLIFSDTYFHLGIASDIRRNKMRVPDSLSYFILPNKHRYPFLFHWLWAFIPRSLWRYGERFFSAFADTCIAFLFWFFIRCLENGNDETADWILAMYVFSPGLLRTGDGPRVFNMSPRLFGVAIYTVHLFLFYFASKQSDGLLFLISASTAALLFFSAIFSVQALLFIAPGIILFYDYRYSLVVIGAFILSYPLSFGRSPALFIAALRHSIYYAGVQSKILYPRFVSFPGYLRAAFGKIKTLFTGGNISAFVGWYISESNFLHLLFTMFTPVLLVFVAMTQPEFLIKSGSTIHFSIVVFFSGFAIFVLTKHKPFLFLGSGERYVEYVYGFGLVVAGMFIAHSGSSLLVWLFCFYGLMLYVFIARQYIYGNRQTALQTIELHRFLTTQVLGADSRVLPLNANHSKLLHYYCPDAQILVYQTIRDEKRLSNEEMMRLWPAGMNYPTADLDYVISKYAITHIFCRKTELDHYLNVIYTDTVKFYDRFSVTESSENYCILKLNKRDR